MSKADSGRGKRGGGGWGSVAMGTAALDIHFLFPPPEQ